MYSLSFGIYTTLIAVIFHHSYVIIDSAPYPNQLVNYILFICFVTVVTVVTVTLYYTGKEERWNQNQIQLVVQLESVLYILYLKFKYAHKTPVRAQIVLIFFYIFYCDILDVDLMSTK